jgi:site-specific recombinase XerD
MKKQYPIPQPIFDNLENFSHENISNLPHSYSKKDYQATVEFLRQYDGNKATFEAYRREIERLIQWSWYIYNNSVLLLKRQDIENYIQFCLKPPKLWIGLKRVTRFIDHQGKRKTNPQWRPFVATVNKQDHKKGIKPDKSNYQLSQKSIREIFTVLNSFYQHLLIEEKVTMNPVALIRQKSRYIQKTQKQSIVMRLNEIQWNHCLKTAEKMAKEIPEKHEKTLFMMNAFYLLYLRISELASSQRWTPQMGHFYKDSHGNWWFKTLGKGNKARNIAVSDSMLSALKRYQKHLNLTPLPSLNDKTPLIPKERGKGALASTHHIRKIVQECFDRTIQVLQDKKLNHDANSLEFSTVHWLRHTGISDDINKRDRPVSHVSDDAGHTNRATTERYNDIELTERHKSAKHKNTSTRKF